MDAATAPLTALALRRDPAPEPARKALQTAIAIGVPVLGAAPVLHLLDRLAPEALPRSPIAHPLRSPLCGGSPAPDGTRGDGARKDPYRPALRFGGGSGAGG